MNKRKDNEMTAAAHARVSLHRRLTAGLDPRGWRKMTWAIHACNVLALVLILGQIEDTPAKEHCRGDQMCAALVDAGRGIAVAIILIAWLVVLCPLVVAWFMTRPRRRVCPACGAKGRPGWTCRGCGHDFALADAQAMVAAWSRRAELSAGAANPETPAGRALSGPPTMPQATFRRRG